MTGLLFATIVEARATIDRLGAQECLTGDPTLARDANQTPNSNLRRAHGPALGADCDQRSIRMYRFAGGVIAVSGMGEPAAARATEYLVDVCGVTTVINAGVCGALAGDLKPGDLVRVSEVVGIGSVSAGPLEAFPPARLVSVDSGLFGGERRTALATQADIVDMEGATVAQVCRRRGVDVGMLKGVTDRADTDGREHLQANIEPVSAQLADAIATVLTARKHTGSFWKTLARFVRIEHSIFSLPLLLAGAYLGAGRTWPDAWTLALIVLAGVSARTLGMAANRIFDRKLDALNPRTAGRELPSGRMSLSQAAAVAVAALAVYVAAAAALGPLCLILSPIPAACMILYPLGKRFSRLCHFGIGLCMALGPIGAFVAAADSLDFTLESLLLSGAAFAWISGFDILYALQDIDADRATGVRSLPASLGSRGAQVISGAVHTAAAVAAIGLWILGGTTPAAGAVLIAAWAGLVIAYLPQIDPRTRFFPISVISGLAIALIPILGQTP